MENDLCTFNDDEMAMIYKKMRPIMEILFQSVRGIDSKILKKYKKEEGRIEGTYYLEFSDKFRKKYTISSKNKTIKIIGITIDTIYDNYINYISTSFNLETIFKKPNFIQSIFKKTNTESEKNNSKKCKIKDALLTGYDLEINKDKINYSKFMIPLRNTPEIEEAPEIEEEPEEAPEEEPEEAPEEAPEIEEERESLNPTNGGRRKTHRKTKGKTHKKTNIKKNRKNTRQQKKLYRKK
jgi:hypothetical protein